MSLSIVEVRRLILLTLYKHETGERRHDSGRHYLDPRELRPFLEKEIDDVYLQRVLRIMLEDGSVEIFKNILVYRISDKGLLEAESYVHGRNNKSNMISKVSPNSPARLSNDVDWAKWGTVAAWITIPLTVAGILVAIWLDKN